jgi:hypothetical protein
VRMGEGKEERRKRKEMRGKEDERKERWRE